MNYAFVALAALACLMFCIVKIKSEETAFALLMALVTPALIFIVLILAQSITVTYVVQASTVSVDRAIVVGDRAYVLYDTPEQESSQFYSGTLAITEGPRSFIRMWLPEHRHWHPTTSKTTTRLYLSVEDVKANTTTYTGSK